MFKLKVLSQVVAAAVASSLLVGCGSGSSSGTAATTTTHVTGSAFASYVSGASVVAIDGTATIAGPVTTTANGGFTLPIPNEHLRSQLVFVATGGTYIDEATGEEATSEELSVVAGANTLTGGSSIHATPSSSIIQKLITKHGKTKAEAENAFKAAFGYLPNTAVAPVDVTKDSDAEEAPKLAGVRAAAFSQLIKNLGLDKDDHSALLEALAEDLADDMIDGMNGSVAVQLKGGNMRRDLAAQFSLALMDFAKGSQNKSGLNPGKVGLIKFIPKVESEDFVYKLTPKGKVEEGKVTFYLTITDPDTVGSPGAPQKNIQPKMTPMMYMAGGHEHSTPNTGCTATNDDGIAECTAYFLMASSMANGNIMGNWDLKFTVNDANEVHFFPSVMMAMGDDTSRLKLSGDIDDADSIDMMGKKSARNYYVYKNLVTGTTGHHTVEFFIATQDSMTMFPLVNGNGAETGALVGKSVTLKVGAEDAISSANGVWSVDVGTLVDGEQGSLELTLTVAGEAKPAGTFKLTPKTM